MVERWGGVERVSEREEEEREYDRERGRECERERKRGGREKGRGGESRKYGQRDAEGSMQARGERGRERVGVVEGC